METRAKYSSAQMSSNMMMFHRSIICVMTEKQTGKTHTLLRLYRVTSYAHGTYVTFIVDAAVPQAVKVMFVSDSCCAQPANKIQFNVDIKTRHMICQIAEQAG